MKFLRSSLRFIFSTFVLITVAGIGYHYMPIAVKWFNNQSRIQDTTEYVGIAGLEKCTDQAPNGWPQIKKDGLIPLCRPSYAVLYDPQAKIPVWVSYTLTSEHAVGCVRRSNAFEEDISIPKSSRSELSDYANSGYDKGHMANDADMSWDVNAERESFLLTNMTPQLPSLNRGIWKELETDVRNWAYNRGPLTIYTGPIYVAGDKTIGKNHVTVPHAFFKIIIDDKTQETMAFIFPHRVGLGTDLLPLVTTISTIENLTGIAFPVQSSKYVAYRIWNVNSSATVEHAKKLRCKEK